MLSESPLWIIARHRGTQVTFYGPIVDKGDAILERCRMEECVEECESGDYFEIVPLERV